MSSPGRSSRSQRSTSRATGDHAEMDHSDLSDLAAPLPSSPQVDLLQAHGGPGSVMVSEIDLSSPLNYGTPGSVGSSLRTPRSGARGTPIRCVIIPIVLCAKSGKSLIALSNNRITQSIAG